MSKFVNKATENGKRPAIMEGREKGDFSTLIGTEITISDFALFNGETGKYAVINLESEPHKFYNAPSVISQLLIDVVDDEFNGDVKAAIEEFKMDYAAGVKLKLKLVSRVSKKTGKKYTAYEV